MLVLMINVFGCDSDKSLTVQNPSPKAEIVSPSSGDSVLEGFVTEFSGTVTDSNHTPDQLKTSWFVNGEVVCDDVIPDVTGMSRCDISLGLEDSEIILAVRDPENARAEDSVVVMVVESEAPSAQIIRPQMTGVYYADQLITFEGVVSDAEDSISDLSAYWNSNVDGVLEQVDTTPDSSGNIQGYSSLSEGTHAIELHVEDSTGKTNRESVIIEIGPPNSSPLCEIISPADGAAGPQGGTVEFEATVSDVDISPEQLTVAWSSDKDGPIGSSIPTSDGNISFAYANLSVNPHTVTLMVTDEVGATCSTAIDYTVGTPPSIVIDSPQDGAMFQEGENITFSATVMDDQDISDLLLLDWVLNGTSVSSQGATSSGTATFSDATVPYGVHTLVVTATDTDGLTDADQLSFTVNGIPTTPVVSIQPDPARTDDSLVINIDTASIDPEGASVSYTYEWLLGGVVQPLYSSSTLPSSATSKDQQWSIKVTPSDGFTDGIPGTNSILIENTPPIITSVTISPQVGTFNDVIYTCSPTVLDPDETPTITMEWTLNSTIVSTGATLNASSLGLMPNDSVACTATAVDSSFASVSDSVQMVIVNRDPMLTNTLITPTASVTMNSMLTCSATVNDPDGEIITPQFSWTIGNSNYSGAALDLTTTSVTVGDTVTCTVDAVDGYGGSASDSVSILVENAIPVVDSIVLSQTTLYTNDTIEATVVLSDSDTALSSLTAEYVWHVIDSSNGNQDIVVYSGVGSLFSNLDGQSYFDKDDVVYVVVTANDGISSGYPLSSGSVMVNNSVPMITSVTVDPDPAIVGDDDLICTVIASDDDGDSLTYDYEWINSNGVQQNTIGSSSDSDVFLAGGTSAGIWECLATVYDGNGLSGQVSDTTIVENGCTSLEFDGIDDYVDLGQGSDLLNIQNTYSITLWVYKRQSLSMALVDLEGSRSTTATNNSGLSFEMNADGTVFGAYGTGVDAGEDTIASNVGYIPIYRWTHVAITRNGGVMSFYINGQLDSTSSSLPTGNISYNGGGYETDIYQLGAYVRNGIPRGEFFDGYMQDVRVWNSELSGTGIDQVFLGNDVSLCRG